MPTKIDLMDADALRESVEQNMEDPQIIGGIRLLLRLKAKGILPEAIDHVRKAEKMLYAKKAHGLDHETKNRVMWELIGSEIFAHLGNAYSEKTGKLEGAQPGKERIRISRELYDLMESCIGIYRPDKAAVYSIENIMGELRDDTRRRKYLLQCDANKEKLDFTVDINKETGEISYSKLDLVL